MRALVTGGGGFLGRYIVEQLVARGDEVVSFSRGAYPELDRLGARTARGDLRDRDALIRAAEGVDAVFHVAAKAGLWGPWDEFYAVNVTGTEHVVAACRANGVPKLIYTSSPSVIFDNTSQVGVDESYPYPADADYESPYPHTKALAERAVIAANGPDLATVSLRPHLIFGPRDTHLLPGLLDAARSGRLPQVGDGANVVDLTYVTDAARAHLLAADALTPDSPVAGAIYFISQDDPVVLWPWIRQLLRQLDLPGPRARLSLPVARALGAVLEAIYRVLPLQGEPPMTRFLASELAQSHTYDISRAKRELGYHPQTSMAQALEQTVAYFG
ncbi:MAG: NAD-dependent epimerase/dehydratase family protein, partial [Anaerolineales bacterium]